MKSVCAFFHSVCARVGKDSPIARLRSVNRPKKSAIWDRTGDADPVRLACLFTPLFQYFESRKCAKRRSLAPWKALAIISVPLMLEKLFPCFFRCVKIRPKGLKPSPKRIGISDHSKSIRTQRLPRGKSKSLPDFGNVESSTQNASLDRFLLNSDNAPRCAPNFISLSCASLLPNSCQQM